jgi:hypothetical protein
VAAATQLSHENRSTTTHNKERNMWDVGEELLPFKQNYLPQVYLSLMNLKFLSLTELEKWALLHDYDDSEERYPVMYLPARICSMRMPEYSSGSDKSGNVD